MQLPDLPTNVDVAWNGYKRIHPTLQSSIQDLDESLKSLYAKARTLPPLGPSLKVPKHQIEEAKFLTGILNDPIFDSLQGSLVNAWNQWEQTLVRYGLAVSTNRASVPTANKSKPEDKALSLRLKGCERFAIARESQLDFLTEAGQFNDPHGWFDPEQYQMYADNLDHHDARIAMVRKKQVVANHEAPNLALAWNPMAAHLNACTQQILAFDEKDHADPGSPEFQALAIQARITLLERFRASMWFSDVIWSLMAAKPLPANLQDVSRPSQP